MALHFQGDSGGPLVCQRNDEFILVGNTSGGSSICDVLQPSLYVRTSHHRAWIKEISGL